MGSGFRGSRNRTGDAGNIQLSGTGFGRKQRYAVRVGFENVSEAQKLCDRLRARGGACGVTKN